jgi:Ala-tRNA(Pro) deacylase
MTISSRLKTYLEDGGVTYDVVRHPRTSTSSQTARLAHVPGAQMAKSVVVHHEMGYALAVVPSTHRVELGALQTALDRRLGLATETEIERLFDDCDAGAVPPIGAAYGLPVIMDDSIADATDVYFEGGDHLTLVHVSGDAFRALTKDAQRSRISHPA